ncbi:SNF2 family N-terminal domain-containing protein [Gigaspora rosea]|uniref:Proliferation-associated SNF2-like protein n=1 Tax=Gigaspora rosea TaxID=44941 RepID=A0A397V545_9GLOM|nr:SNF2 family N-terminal domain-containing protein [Gigaspora rosea]
MSEIKEELIKMNSDISDSTGASTPPPLDKDSPSFLSTDSSVHTPTDESIVTDHMRKEEAKLVNESEKENLKILKEKAVADYDALVDKQRVQRLKFLLEKSSLYAQFLANKMERQQEEQRERAQAEEARRTNAKEKEDRIKSGPTRRSSRISAKSADTVSTESPAKSVTKKRSNVGKKRKVNDANYNISDYLDNQEVPKRRKSSESLTDPVDTSSQVDPVDTVDTVDTEDDEPIPSVKVDDLEPNLVISARQPRLVTGGVLREYQLTGVEWLVSLYDNGLNGILADEMGLGKTLQTIAFLAYLWERKIYGPFLIVAPLSTLANWISEIHRFTPTIPCVLYHGTPEQRAHIRSRKLKKLDHTFPIVVTSYEIAMNDRKYLQKFAWKYIVVDEGHRIKNLNCKLIRELKTYHSANRLLLTGTPLQNNLAELWSLLNFLLPDIFDDLDSFQDWFDFSALHEQDGETQILAREQSNEVISNLHKILKPFLLRRIKSDVEYDLPKKKEFLLYAPLTLQQVELYDAILNRNIRPFLLAKKMGSIHENGSIDMEIDETEQIKSPEEEVNNCTNEERVEEQAEDRKQTLRALQRKTYREITDDEFFDALEMEESDPEVDEEEALKNSIKNELEVKTRKAVKSINSMRLQNVVMQLRKICNHPYLFDWPVDKETELPKVTEELAAASGKMILLESLLESLFERGHKVLIFSQFTTMLDIIDDWATLFKGWNLCRIDGSIGQEDRRQQIHDFNTNPEIRLFILSTRAGGLGINLTAADTVIIYDSDWNPQMDLQAQDRVHRIGQTKPVIIYRLVTANTVEGKILEKATAKRKLEKLVIHKGKFKLPTSRDLPIANLAELAEILMADDSEKFQLAQHGDAVIPESDLIRLMDRSDAAFEKLGTEEAQEEKGVMFKVISEVRDANNDALAQISRND